MNKEIENNAQSNTCPKQTLITPLQILNGINTPSAFPGNVPKDELPKTSPDVIDNLILGIDEMTKEVVPATSNQRIEKTTLGKIIEVVRWITAIIACAYVASLLFLRSSHNPLYTDFMKTIVALIPH